MTNISDFQRESYRIDEQIWDAMALRAGERVLFLGLPNDGAWLTRGREIGVRAEALTSDEAMLARIEALGAIAIRGSATMIPATDQSYDVAVAMHYLHEIDPGFHAQVIAELARVAKRVVLIEPSPPADPLGRRIAALYARARREEGQFEGYQPLDYWRKLLAIVKGDVWQSLLTFTRVPPPQAVSQTVQLVLEAMAIEAMPESYLDELRELAARPDAHLLPLSRIVLVGAAAGEAPLHGAVERFRPGVDVAPPEPPAKVPALTGGGAAAPPAEPPESFGFAAEDAPQLAPAKSPAKPPAKPAAKPPKVAPKRTPPAPAVPQPPPAAAGQTPFGAPFALGGEGDDDDDVPFGGGAAPPPKDGFGWSWEPPEEEKPPS
ncbi:MAG: methyltransferase domain-containing protein [Vulcanimicrobiaceae bacterium]|jgi:hypothetical protein